MKISAQLVLISAMCLVLLSMPANAQATRTWVSGVGDDANPCSRTAPCKTFAGAISKTASPGEINCLDPAGFGALTITKAITILCDAVSNGGVLVSGTNGITVNLSAAGNVVLSGLDFEGIGTGLNGVSMIGLGKLTIRNSSIRNFTQNGVNLAGGASARVYIVNTLITNCAGGVNVGGTGGVANFATLVDSVVDANTSFGVQTTNAAGKITLKDTELTGSPAAIIAFAGSAVISVGPSNFLTGTGTPTSTQAFQ
jgi:hypothetical protein